MTNENLIYYEPTEAQIAKFRRINETPEWMHSIACTNCNNCAECHAAIHQHLLSTTTHRCTYGISEERFRILMSSADCEY